MVLAVSGKTWVLSQGNETILHKQAEEQSECCGRNPDFHYY
jgi:hypothetical protein